MEERRGEFTSVGCSSMFLAEGQLYNVYVLIALTHTNPDPREGRVGLHKKIVHLPLCKTRCVTYVFLSSSARTTIYINIGKRGGEC